MVNVLIKKKKESEILRSICDYLQIKGYYYWRQNSTGIYDTKRKCFRSTPKGFKKGIADIFVLSGHYTIALEIKSETGKMSPYQKDFEHHWLKSDFRYYHIVRSVDDVIELGL